MTENSKDWTANDRKNHPIFTGVLRYFPDALLEVAELSKIGNDQHNPGEELHWARGKSNDQGDALVRHQLDAGTRDSDGVRHSAKVAWRALAQLQLEIEADAKRISDEASEEKWPGEEGWSPAELRKIGQVWSDDLGIYQWDGHNWIQQ